MADRAIYTPPEVKNQREDDKRDRSKKGVRLYGLMFILFVLIGGGIVLFTDPQILSFFSGKNMPSFVKSSRSVVQPVAILVDETGKKVLSTVGCVYGNQQLAVAPLSYFERVKNEKVFLVEDIPAITEAFGCLAPLLIHEGFGSPVSVTIGSEVFVERETAIYGVFSAERQKI
ncbi:MAG: hypothetical protein ACTSXV_00040, partial [Alphaproteobacteria bacterium]